ncbi:MAG TPA: hypothetical protein VJ982_10695 [Gemmatimonadota bacterium]|nr:hypothetical protein [Gemmatimonadota bacterium]
MKRMTCLWIAALLSTLAGCSDDDGPVGTGDKALIFSFTAPQSVPTKQVVDLEIRVTEARLVNYPLTVTFEEANDDQTFEVVATVLLQKPEDTIASISEEAARDPLYRVTICEAGGGSRLCVERTVQVDVVDFP